ncbi:nucleic acid/nucleotide deaminase domain-containing protein [Actinomadura sp. 9N215]|uniref:nucleic acid/nucleotide deaminase domain-containing protein n=1 Tax=Actinomadura sp. 9N215 TaxID=3375150 RepID=UPI0037A71EA6
MTAEIMARFGPKGVRRIPPSELPGADAAADTGAGPGAVARTGPGTGALPPDAARALADPGLPLQVGPYFTASTGEPLALAEYAATIGYPDAIPTTPASASASAETFNEAPGGTFNDASGGTSGEASGRTSGGTASGASGGSSNGTSGGTSGGTFGKASREASGGVVDAAGWCRVGTDHGAEICVTGAGDVQAVFVTATAPPMTVNGSVPAFIASLLALDRYLPPLASPGDRNPAEIFRELRQALLEIDEPALADDEAWWPRVLEQIRHALSFPFAAAVEYEDANGGKHVETEQARVGLPHPERLLWDRLDARGIAPGQVTRVYTELEPCFLPGNYCRTGLSRFRNAEFTYSFDYGATADERERGLLELMRQAAGATET